MNTDTDLAINQFNDQALEFITKMIILFPEEGKLSTYKLMYMGLSMMNPKQPVVMFMESLEPYGLQIMTKNEHFFKADEYVSAAQSMSEQMGLVDKWDSISPETKNAIWDHVQILYALGMHALGKTEEFKKIIMSI
jgi:hypothetical protein